MTGLITDSNTRHLSIDTVDAAPIERKECLLERLIKDRAKRLNDERENLSDRLERFIMHRAIHHWTPPKHPSYNLIDARLKSFDKWPKLGELPTPESLWRRWLLVRRYVHCFFTIFGHTSFIIILLLSNFIIAYDDTTCFHCGISLHDWLPGDIPFHKHVRWSPFCVYVRYIKGPTFVKESQRFTQQNGRAEIYSVATKE